MEGKGDSPQEGREKRKERGLVNPAPEIMRKVEGQGQWSIYHRVPMPNQILPPKQVLARPATLRIAFSVV